MRIKILFILWFTAISLLSCGQNDSNGRPKKWAQAVSELKLENVYKIDRGVYRSEQPDREGFAELEKFGIKEVLNLRNWHSDDKKAQGTNLILHRVDMDAHDINNHDVVAALRIIKNRKGAIVFHCKHGSDRTGVITAMYRIIIQGWSKDDAIKELKEGGYGFHRIYVNIPNYIKNADIEKLKEQVFER